MLHKFFPMLNIRGIEILRYVAQTPNDRLRGHRNGSRWLFLYPRRRLLGRRPHSRGFQSHGSLANCYLLLCVLTVFSAGLCANAVQAAPPSPAPASAPPASAPTTIPDYGGRDSAPPVLEAGAPNPAAQAGRAVEALVVVLVGIVGVVYALKRFGLVKPGVNGQPAKITLTGRISSGRISPGRASADSPVTIVSSQSLPGGGMLHVVRVGDRNLLLAATPQAVTSITEWPVERETAEEMSEFEDYLTRAEAAPNSGIAAANARLRSLLSRPDSEES